MSGDAGEDVGAAQRVRQRAPVGVGREALLVRIHVLCAPAVDDARGVDHQQVFGLHAEVEVHACAGDAGRACAGEHDAYVGDVLAHDLECVQQRGRGDDRRPVLVVVQHGDVEPGTQLLLDVEAFGGFDVLEVDAAERGCQRGDDVDQPVRVLRVQLEVEHVDAGEPLEQHGLALHHRLGCQRADVAQPEHRGAVGDDRDEVALAGEAVGVLRVGLDRQARPGHARCVGERQVVLGDARFRRCDLQLPGAWQLVILEHLLVGNHGSSSARRCTSSIMHPPRVVRGGATVTTLRCSSWRTASAMHRRPRSSGTRRWRYPPKSQSSPYAP